MENVLDDKDISFVANDFVGCDFKDKRFSKRILDMAQSFIKRPGSIITAIFVNKAKCKAAYNFFDSRKVTQKRIQEPHIAQTIQKVNEHNGAVLMVHDTSYVSFKNGKAFENSTGYLNKTSKGDKIRGFAIHSSLAITDDGIPLGLAKQTIYEHSKTQESPNHQDQPIEEKESYRWLESIREIAENIIKNQNVIHIADREGDIFEVLSYSTQTDTKVIIRSSYDRLIGENYNRPEGKVFEKLNSQSESYEAVEVIYDQEKSKEIKRKLQIKFTNVTIPVPRKKTFEAEKSLAKNVKMNVVEVKSIDGLKELHWVLYTNLDVRSEASALRVIEYYKKRWHIENYHKVIKTGFQIEEIRLEDSESIKKMISLIAILGIRLYYVIHLSRINPDDSSEGILDRHEWECLVVSDRKYSYDDPEKKAPTNSEAIIMIAKLGGYLNRKNDKTPGILVIWRGWVRLMERADYHKLISKSTKTYG